MQLNAKDMFSFNPIFGEVSHTEFPEQPKMDRLLSISLIRPEDKNVDDLGYNSYDEQDDEQLLPLKKLDAQDFQRRSSGIRSDGDATPQGGNDLSEITQGTPAVKYTGNDISDNLSFLTKSQEAQIVAK